MTTEEVKKKVAVGKEKVKKIFEPEDLTIDPASMAMIKRSREMAGREDEMRSEVSQVIGMCIDHHRDLLPNVKPSQGSIADRIDQAVYSVKYSLLFRYGSLIQ